jgi:sugar phosphate isomerase/epimerase
MHHFLYPMDTCFFSSMGECSFETMCEMAAEIGYDGIYLCLSDSKIQKALPQCIHVKKKYGLEVAGVWVTVDLSSNHLEQAEKLRRVLHQLPSACDLELSFTFKDGSVSKSSEEGDDAAVRFLEPLLKLLDGLDCHICFYPHLRFWGERLEDGIRLWKKIQHPQFKTTFCGFHWYALGNHTNLDVLLAEAAPSLGSVNLCGTRKGPLGEGTTIEPLDCGEMDNFSTLAILERNGYRGKVGLQGWGRGGDVYSYLERDFRTFRAMETRLSKHPSWGVLEKR